MKKPYRPTYLSEDFELWLTKISEGLRLKIINEGDFHHSKLMESTGLKSSPLASSFGLNSEAADEIKARSTLLKFIVDNEKLMNFLLEGKPSHNVPIEENQFLAFYDQDKEHNPYWQFIYDFIDLAEKAKGTMPKRLAELVKNIKGSLPLESSEKEMAVFIAEKLRNVTYIEGFVDFKASRTRHKELNDFVRYESDHETNSGCKSRGKNAKTLMENIPPEQLTKYCKGEAYFIEDLDMNGNSAQVFGHSAFSKSLSSLHEPEQPYQVGNYFKYMYDWCIFFFSMLIYMMRRKAAFKDMVLDSRNLPSFLWDELKEGVEEHLENLLFKGYDPANLIFQIHFVYDQDGLRFQIYNIRFERNSDYTLKNLNFEGYSSKQEKKIKKIRQRYNDSYRHFLETKEENQIYRMINLQNPNLFNESSFSSLDSPKCDKRFKWYAVQNLLEGSEAKGTYTELKKHRKYLAKHFYQLQCVAEIATIQKKFAEKAGANLSEPEMLLNGEHLVEIKELYPLHLFCNGSNTDKVIPFRNMPVLNGQMVGLTGRHAGGKTTAEEAWTDQIYLAQSGLLVFADHFRWNPKDILGMVFVERGAGSTCELLVEKIANIFKSIKGCDPSKVVIVLDELGTGTQEGSGEKLGEDVLRTLRDIGVSVIFSTQIQELAKYAEKHLDALCLSFDNKHGVRPGISDGGLDDLRKTKGLNQHLHMN